MEDENKTCNNPDCHCDGECDGNCSCGGECDGTCSCHENENASENGECNGDCASCAGGCSPHDNNFEVKLNQYSSFKKIIGVVSGKGGVGKSFVSSLLAVTLAQKGLNVGIMDADITGPSIAKTFNVKQKAYGQDNLIVPYVTPEYGIRIISSNMLLENDDDPIVWRGSLIANLVKQFYTDVIWGHQDVLLIDMPPGTGDVSLTTFQSIPLDGIIVVTTPQDLVSMIVTKALKMAKMMNVNVLGVIENMAYVECPNCGEKIYMYGKSHTEEMLKPFGIECVATLPINPHLTELVSEGRLEEYQGTYLDDIGEAIYDSLYEEDKA